MGEETKPCIYCGEGKYLLTAKNLGTWTNGIVKTFIDNGSLKTIYEECELAGMSTLAIFNLSEFKMRYCPMCGREMNKPKYRDHIEWTKIEKDTIFDIHPEMIEGYDVRLYGGEE